MADDEEKTEQPTEKKIGKAKEEGNVSKSTEVVGAGVLLFGTLYLFFLSSFTFKHIEAMMIYDFSFISKNLNSALFFAIALKLILSGFYVLLPLFALVLILTFALNWAQFGILFVPLKLKLEKINPISGFKSLFTFKKFIEALKLTMKLLVIFIVMTFIFMSIGTKLLAMMNMSTRASLSLIGDLLFYFLATILFIIIIFAAIDFFFIRFNYIKSLMMSKQEIKDEFKNAEGDPQVKSRIRGIQMKMARQRMINAVPDADVVITNPTHYAVAMRYNIKKDKAPIIVAKGINFIAFQIRDKAREHNITIIENPPLARALYEQVEVEQEIPDEFYKALADIFSYIYDLKSKK